MNPSLLPPCNVGVLSVGLSGLVWILLGTKPYCQIIRDNQLKYYGLLKVCHWDWFLVEFFLGYTLLFRITYIRAE